MIKIPEYKYKGVDNKHYEKIRKYLEDNIKYIQNCCKLMNGTIDSEKFISEGEKFINNKKSRISLINKLTTEECNNYEQATYIIKNKKLISEMEDKNLLKFLEELINCKSKLFIDKIIKSKPKNLLMIDKYAFDENVGKYSSLVIYHEINGKKMRKYHEHFIKIINRIFNYELFIDNGFKDGWNAYKLTEDLNIDVCPYCNRQYTFTVKKNKKKNISRPELDHYLPKSKYPLFALSFYNLIPCCHICNSNIKSDYNLDFENYLHPYISGAEDEKIFTYYPISADAFVGKRSEIKINICDKIEDNKLKNTIDFFEISNIYKKHNGVVAELIRKSEIYNNSLIDEINRILQNTGKKLSKNEVFQSIFCEPEKSKIIDISLGKLKYDVIEELKENYSFDELE